MTPPPAEHLARVFVGPTLRAQPDRRLVDLVRDGYDAAFEEIVRRYRRPLDRFAAAIVGGRSEDVTQDAFSKALPALRGSEATIELRPWLYRIVRNTALNDLRDRAPLAEELRETMPGARSAAAEVESREEIRDLMGRLRALPEPQRAALVMRELEGLSHEEIAAALGVSGGAARQAIYRARAALRDGFGLLIPMPVLRALADHADDAARAGGAIAAGAGASSAGGAVLGGLGGGALKVGVATVLIAGTVGAGVAIENHGGGRPGPDAAEAAPLVKKAGGRSGWVTGGGAGDDAWSRSGHGDGEDARGEGSGRGEDRSGGDGGLLADGDRSGPNSGSSGSGGDSNPSGDGGGHGGSGPNSGPGSISGHDGSDDSGSEDHGGSGSGSDDTGIDDHSGSSDSGSGDDGFVSGGNDGGGGGGGDSSGPGSGEIESEPVPTTPEAEVEDGGTSGSDDESSGSGSGDLTGGDVSGETSGLDASP
ncbi:MAG TPA: RNA polymerase sigma factor [Solirubrobacterales bacterium]|nr:RNA polymerase sigma factor [Solirubrobacterales bacterium]